MQAMRAPAFRIAAASTRRDVAAARGLIREYTRWLGEDLRFQGIDRELAGLPGEYAAPRGALLLARDDRPGASAAAGCIALRPWDAQTGELKRLYVRPAYRGRGLGIRLAARAVDAARDAGYRRLVLDTLERMQDAVRLYRKLGCVAIEPYYDNPLPGALYFALELGPSALR